MEDLVIIGAGVIGAFIALNASKYEMNVTVIEKSFDVGDGTSMANSAIVHSGYDPLPGTKKSYFNRLGNAMFDEVSKDLDVPFERIGSLTLAFTDEELDQLKGLLERAKQNQVEARLIDHDELMKIEPKANKEAIAALYCPSAGIIDPFSLVAHAFENAIDNGVKLRLGEEVIGISRAKDHFEVKTSKGVIETRFVINAAGLGAKKIAEMIEEVPWSIIPRKGQYHVISKDSHVGLRHTLFPLPSNKGKGVLASPTTGGDYIVGPSSEIVIDPNDVSTDSNTLLSVKEMGLRLCPSLLFPERIRTFAGVRSTPSTHDFIIEYSKTYKEFINVAGIESPGLASAPAIGKYVIEELLLKEHPFSKKDNYVKTIRPRVRPLLLDDKKRDELIKTNPFYGILVCRCEKVSMAEINDELSRSLPCLNLKALRKRVRAGFGHCQGGFCQPMVAMLLSKHLHCRMEDLDYGGTPSKLLSGKSK